MAKKNPAGVDPGELVEIPHMLDTTGKGGERVLYCPAKLIGITERGNHAVLLFDGGVSMELAPSYDEFIADLEGDEGDE
jgi:hypothetical protein